MFDRLCRSTLILPLLTTEEENTFTTFSHFPLNVFSFHLFTSFYILLVSVVIPSLETPCKLSLVSVNGGKRSALL